MPPVEKAVRELNAPATARPEKKISGLIYKTAHFNPLSHFFPSVYFFLSFFVKYSLWDTPSRLLGISQF